MKKIFLITTVAVFFIGCKKGQIPKGKDINKAQKVSVDRFSAAAGHLFVREGDNGLPNANQPVDFDRAPFITQGFGPDGSVAQYYNFDVQPVDPDDIYVFFKKGSSTPITGQNNVIPSIPGEGDYNDFWVVNKVTVPDYYVPNTLTNEKDILASGLPIEKTNMIVNCPVVPFGSVAAKKFGGGSQALTIGWYNDKAVAYFQFDEAELTATASGQAPVDDIYVMFNDNATGPASGFKTEPGTVQTHNVLASKPGASDYSPLWVVHVLDNAEFANVKNITTAEAATDLNPNAALVNCPVVK